MPRAAPTCQAVAWTLEQCARYLADKDIFYTYKIKQLTAHVVMASLLFVFLAVRARRRITVAVRCRTGSITIKDIVALVHLTGEERRARM